MAITATRTYEDYEREQREKALADVDERAAAYKQNSDRTLSQIGAAIDKSANTAAGIYQKRIDGADSLYKKQYADNAIDEAFAREQIKNSMAASGMTDSGQNLTMQTALSLQKNNRDNEVSERKRNYVQEMQDAIDAVWADAAAKKSEQEISAQQNYQTFYDNLYTNAMNGARTNAVNLYNADIAAQQEAYKAEQERLAKEQEAYYDSLLKLAETASKTDSNREAYALNMMKNMGYTEDQAWAAAYTRYPTGDKKTDTYNRLYGDALASGLSKNEAAAYANAGGGSAGQNAVSNMRESIARSVIGNRNLLDGNDGFNSIETMFRLAPYDGKYVYKHVTKVLETMPTYNNLSEAEKEYAQAIAIGNTLSQHWASDIKSGKTEKMLSRLNGMADKLTDTQYKIIAKQIGLKIE